MCPGVGSVLFRCSGVVASGERVQCAGVCVSELCSCVLAVQAADRVFVSWSVPVLWRLESVCSVLVFVWVNSAAVQAADLCV